MEKESVVEEYEAPQLGMAIKSSALLKIDSRIPNENGIGVKYKINRGQIILAKRSASKCFALL